MIEAPAITTSLFVAFCAALRKLPPAISSEVLNSLPPAQRDRIHKFWEGFAHPHQLPPLLAQGGAPWTTWLILGGRGAGKTRAGAEWVRAQALDPRARIALIGETARDVREVMIEGVSGLLSVHEHGARPTWEPSR